MKSLLLQCFQGLSEPSCVPSVVFQFYLFLSDSSSIAIKNAINFAINRPVSNPSKRFVHWSIITFESSLIKKGVQYDNSLVWLGSFIIKSYTILKVELCD